MKSQKTYALYSGEGYKRKLVGWLTEGGTILTPGHQVSEAIRSPKEWVPVVPVNKQMFPNKHHHSRVHAVHALKDEAVD